MPNMLWSKVKQTLRRLGPVLVACIFAGAVWLLYREVSKYSFADIRMSLSRISTWHILLSIFLTIINYIILIGYDWLALKGIHKTLPLTRVSLVSFVGQAVSYNFGALLGGSTVRYRFYSAWGFSPLDIVRLVLMLAITFWVGALGLVGLIFMIAPPAIPPELGLTLPFQNMRPLGAILFLAAMSYLVVCKCVHKPIHIFGKEFAFPPFRIAVAQAIVAGADLIAAGACLYVLLPPDSGLSFIEFLPTYLLAMVAVVLTHVPGGAGVLEVVILHLTSADPQDVFAALICFRAIYYLLPLLAAAVIFAIYEIRQQTTQTTGTLHDVTRWMHAFSPTVMAFAVFGMGALICFSVVLPISPDRFEQIMAWIPLQVMETASVVTGMTGAALLFLAPGIQHRQRYAYTLTIVLLWAGFAGSLLYSLNWLVALFLLIGIFSIRTIRQRCRRPSSLWKLNASPRWITGSLLVLFTAAGLGLVLHHADAYLPDTWLRSEYTAHAPRLVRILTSQALLFLCLALGYARTAPLRRHKKNGRIPEKM